MKRPPLRLALLFAALLPCLLAAEEPSRRVEVSEDFSAVLDGGRIAVEVRPLDGEAVADFARRISRDDASAARLLAAPVPPSRTRTVILPYASLSDEARLAAVRALFPSDARATIGWLHVAVGDEPLPSIASWFTGDERLAGRLAELNGLSGAVATRGMLVKVPVEYLLPPFRDAEPIPDEEPPHLEYGSDAKGRYAVYRLRRKEALYSAVVVRFTGRLHATDVIQLALDIALRSGIDDVHAIPVGFPVKIPLDLLSEEYLPPDDPKTAVREKERAEAALFATPAKAHGLAGVRVVIDAGHGGRDTGTLHHGVWESTYVYDVALRLRKVLLESTRAEVVMMTREPTAGWEIMDRDRLEDAKTHVLLTDPPYRLNDPVAGVNLRWYLANAILRRPGAGGKLVPPEKTVFLSIHADSLHPSVRGAMAYVPGERFLRASYGRATTFYRGFREVRDEPVVSFTKKDRVLAEGAATSLAEKLIGAFRRRGLAVHQFRPVRTHVIRAGREWVPAVLRYNKIPNRVLFELTNLSNDEDRELTLTRSFRQHSAEALAEGLVAFFGGVEPLYEAGPEAGPAPIVELGPEEVPPGISGPWPEVFGPWPSAPRAAPAATRAPVPKPARTVRPVRPVRPVPRRRRH